jgi:hypothetical protein
MNRKAVTVGASFAVAYLWSAVASAIYCVGTGNLAMLRLPFLQWWVVLPYWDANWWVTTWFALAAGIPTLVPLAIAVRFLRSRAQRRDGSQDLYGNTTWPSREQIQRGGFSLRGKL